jgi:2-octaprenyl-6-methoxyphenol hydroxylase
VPQVAGDNTCGARHYSSASRQVINAARDYMMRKRAADLEVDVLVAGAGAAGLSAAIALDRAGFAVACVGHVDRRSNGRTLALFESSLRLYKALGLWERFRDRAAALEKISMIDATKARFRAPSVVFAAHEIGLSAFGANIENSVLVEGLAAIAEDSRSLVLHEGLATDIVFDRETVGAILEDGGRVTAKLAVAADGRHCPDESAPEYLDRVSHA